MKVCVSCHESKPVTMFHKRAAAKDGLQSKCKDCNILGVRQWQEENPDAFEANWRKHSYGSYARLKKRARRYGISADELEGMLLARNGICDICRREPRKWLVVDHCHKTGKIRGILCEDCNRALGLFRDDPEILGSAAKYLGLKGKTMFVYEDGLPVDYIPTDVYPESIDKEVRSAMLDWYRSLPGQARVRMGKVGMMEGSEVNLKRLEHE